jgi:hypothetical protein
MGHLPIPLSRGLWHNSSAMKSCWFFLVFVFPSAVGRGQDQPGGLLSKPDTDRPQALNERPFDWSMLNSQPNGVLNQETDPNWAEASRQKRFDWLRTNTQQRTVFSLGLEPRTSTCVVPLLVVPVNPNTDLKMLINPPRSKFESSGIVKGLPPCANGRLK